MFLHYFFVIYKINDIFHPHPCVFLCLFEQKRVLSTWRVFLKLRNINDIMIHSVIMLPLCFTVEREEWRRQEASGPRGPTGGETGATADELPGRPGVR